MSKPFSFYVDLYNMVGKSRHKAAFRFTKDGWQSLMTHRKWEIERAVEEALKQPELEMLKRWRFKAVECFDCQAQHGMAGQAFTNYTCKSCSITRSHPNTATPTLCTSCAIHQFKCQRCGDSLEKDLATGSADSALNKEGQDE